MDFPLRLSNCNMNNKCRASCLFLQIFPAVTVPSIYRNCNTANLKDSKIKLSVRQLKWLFSSLFLSYSRHERHIKFSQEKLLIGIGMIFRIFSWFGRERICFSLDNSDFLLLRSTAFVTIHPFSLPLCIFVTVFGIVANRTFSSISSANSIPQIGIFFPHWD